MTQRYYRLSARPLGWLLGVVILCSCVQSRVQRSEEPHGFIVVGPRWAAAMQSAAGDTLREIGSPQVSAEVLRASERFASTDRAGDPRCNRYFSAPSRTVVLLSQFCERNYGNVYGSRVFAVFDSDGSLVQEFRTLGTDEILSIMPYLRFRP